MTGIRQSETLVQSNFEVNAGGWPTGGNTWHTQAKMEINWQDGIVGDDGQNGAFVEDVIEAALL